MFAIRKTEAAAGLTWVEDLPRPEIGPHEVLISVTHAGICGTDKHMYEWDEWAQSRVTPPLTLGHEFVGRVVEVGGAVSRLSPGQRVSGEGHIGCGSCRPCRTGQGHICERVQLLGVELDGAFAEYVVLPEANVWIVDDSIPDSVAAILDPLGNAMHTVMAADVTARTVLVTGAGVIGLMAIAIARYAGAYKIIAIDIEERHLELATKMGADHVFNATNADWWQEVRALTKKSRGVDAWLEMSGSAQAINNGFKALCNGGVVALLGLPRTQVPIDLAPDVIFKGATILGINGRRMFETWFQMEQFLSGASADIERLISHRFPANKFDDAFDTLASGHAIKVLLEFPAAGDR